MSDSHDLYLGMNRPITRRDFLNGAAVAVGATLLPHGSGWTTDTRLDPQSQSGYYPPTKTGLRGSHLGSFEIAHRLRDGTFWKAAGRPINTGETYDLVIVGAGISGLAAAFF